MIDANTDFPDDYVGEQEDGESSPLMDRRERWRDPNFTALAFAFAVKPAPRKHPVTVARWSASALAYLQTMSNLLRERKRDLPTIALRGRLELADQQNLRLDRDLGRYYGVILWTQRESEETRTQLNSAMLGWLVNDVASLASSADAERSLIALKDMARAQTAVETERRVADPFHWATTASKTAKTTSHSSYPDLADYVARHLEGQAIFPEFPGNPALRRIAGGQLDQNYAELMTEPVVLGRGGRFSLVVRVRVFSYPGRPEPLVAIEFSRRVWTSKLNDKSSTMRISGYALPDGSTRALRFTLSKQRRDDGQWVFQPDDDFAPIAREYFPNELPTTEKILKNGHNMVPCKLMVVLKPGVGQRSEAKSGVPDLDKMEGFQGIVAALAEIGLTPWQNLVKIESSSRTVSDRNQHWGRRDSLNDPDRQKYQRWLAEAQDSLRACYAGAHHVVIAVQPGYQVEADALFAEARLQEILQGSVMATRIPFSSDAHGPRSQLPGKEFKNPAERAALRVQEWAPFIEAVKQAEQITGHKVNGILVIAHKWYPESRADDIVNKRAARMALAEGLGVQVQYLLPRENMRAEIEQKARHRKMTPDGIEAELDKSFENRLMNGWLDLAYKSLGRLRPSKLLSGIQEIYDTPDIASACPDRILALGVVRRNSQRWIANERSFLPFAIELDLKDGLCLASFAYEHPQSKLLIWSEMLPLPQALTALARLGPIQLSSAQQNRKKQLEERAQTFFKARLSDFGKRSLNPLVIVDADTSRSVWPWLRDEQLDPQNVKLTESFHAEAAWSHVRLVRVRTNNSPKILQDGRFSGIIGRNGKQVSYRTPKWVEAALFKLTDTIGSHVYLSFGSMIRLGRTQGTSSYREIHGIKMKKNDGKQIFEQGVLKRHTDAWTTPQGVEFVVIRPGRDRPDQLARLLEWLRQCYAHFGEWSIKPAPLFFERTLKEYLADYTLEDDEGDEDAEEEEDGPTSSLG
jgi:hypothetical protein